MVLLRCCNGYEMSKVGGMMPTDIVPWYLQLWGLVVLDVVVVLIADG